MQAIWEFFTSIFQAISAWFSSWFSSPEPAEVLSGGREAERVAARERDEQTVEQEQAQGTERPYRLVVRRVGESRANAARGQENTVVDIEMLIVDDEGRVVTVDGREARFTGRTGGFGEGALPGLYGDQDGNTRDGVNASYAFQNGNADIEIGNIGEAFNFNRSQGFFQRMVSPDYIERGLQSDELDQYGAFGIHPDGKNEGGTVTNDGSQGCLAIDTAQARAYAEVYNAIPRHLRPTGVDVVPARASSVSLAQAATEGETILIAGAGDLQTSYNPSTPTDVFAARSSLVTNAIA